MKRHSRKYRIYQPFIVPIVFVLLAAGASFATLKYFQKPKNTPINLEGKVGVPASRIPIDAYSKISRNDLTFIQLTKENLPSDAVIKVSDLMGRVMRRDKKKGYIFRESELFPKGTREGFTAAIPPGKRSFTLSSKKIQGLGSLKKGDRFDLLSVIKPRKTVSSKVKSYVQSAAQKPMTKLIVNNGVVIETDPYKSKNSANGVSAAQRKSGKEYIVAVAFDEIPELLRAIESNESMFILARTGQKTSSQHNDYSPSRANQHGNNMVTVIETITDKKRQSVAVPKE